MSEVTGSDILKLTELIVKTTIQFNFHFSQIRTLYESSDPKNATSNIKELKNIEVYQKKIETYASAIVLITQLEWVERIKLLFQLMNHVSLLRQPLEQMRTSLDDIYLQSSLGSSDFNHLSNTVHSLKNIYTTYIVQYTNSINSIIQTLVHQIFENIQSHQINYDKLSTLYNKYQVLDTYTHVIKYIISHYNAPKVLQIIEVLKDQVLGVKPNNQHSHDWRSFQSYGIMPGKYDTLDKIGGKLDIKIKNESDLTNVAKVTKIQFIIIKKHTQFIYLPENIADQAHIKENALRIDPQFGINETSLNTFDTIKETHTKKIKPSLSFYPKTSKYRKYVILDTYDGTHYRILSPWNVFPIYESSSHIIPESFVPYIQTSTYRKGIYPSPRISSYNNILSDKIIANKGEGFMFETEQYVVTKEQGQIVGELTNWFNDVQIPLNLSEYRELVNSDKFKMELEIIIIKILKSRFSTPGDEIYATIISTASSIARRIARDVLGMTTKDNKIDQVYGMYSKYDKLKQELFGLFKKHITSSVEIIVTYRSLCEPIEKKLVLFTDTT